MSQTTTLSCDVLVTGGGLAATMAAITAAKEGSKIIMVIKGVYGQSGSSSHAAGIISAAFSHVGFEGRRLMIPRKIMPGTRSK